MWSIWLGCLSAYVCSTHVGYLPVCVLSTWLLCSSHSFLLLVQGRDGVTPLPTGLSLYAGNVLTDLLGFIAC
jgi:hypothetical protein